MKTKSVFYLSSVDMKLIREGLRLLSERYKQKPEYIFIQKSKQIDSFLACAIDGVNTGAKIKAKITIKEKQ